MSTIRKLVSGVGGELSSAKILFIIWSITVFLYWVLLSYTAKTMADIPPTVVAVLGLLLGGDGARDYLLGKIKSQGIDYDRLSLSRILFVFCSIVVFILWLIDSWSNSELANIPKTVVTVLGLLAGGEILRTKFLLEN